MESLVTYAQENSEGSGTLTLIWFLLGAYGLWKMFEKASVPGWIGIVPLYRDVKLCEIVMGNPWYCVKIWIAFCLPPIGTIFCLYWKYQVGKATAQAYGKPESWAWGYLFLEPIFYMITGLGDASYYGKFGASDSRTGEARGARTVNYEVIKNEPEPVEVKAADESNDVEFDFNQEVGD